MKKEILAGLSLATLALAGCSTTNISTSAEPSASVTTVFVTAEASAPASSEAPASESANPSESPTPEQTALTSATPSPSASVARKTFYSGTTLKGNNIYFTILDDETQTYLNVNNQKTGLVGAWGKLCSPTALATQLEETGVMVQNSAGEKFVWRSLKYALSEGGRYSDTELAAVTDAFRQAGTLEEDGMTCIAVNTDTKWVLDYNYDFVTIGQYVGSPELLDTIEAR